MKKVVIENAKVIDHKKLTDLVKKSKAHWGYTLSQMKEWDNELTINHDYINSNEVFKLSLDNHIIGCYSYLKINHNTVKLDFFFILPNYIGKGFGKLLMHHFFKKIENDTIKKIMVESDPNAENFYANYGFKTIDKLKSSIENRFLPLMQKDI